MCDEVGNERMVQNISSAGAGRREPSAKATGILCGVGAGALWGLVFLAPELVREFGPLHLTIGRYLCYGIISFLLLAPRWRAVVPALSRKDWKALAWLALTGNTLYFILLTGAVQMGGIAMASLVLGFVPVTVTIIGSRDRGAVPLTRLMPSLLLCIAGGLCIGWQALGAAGQAQNAAASSTQIAGLLCALGALASWTIFAVGNARCLARLPHISVNDWNALTGLMTGAQSLLLIPIALMIGQGEVSDAAWLKLGAVSLGVAGLASILGNALWNRMTRLLPLTLVGQMIVFETLFALLYAFMWESRMPTALESGAFALVVLSILACLAAHRKPAGAGRGQSGQGEAASA